MQLLHSCHDRLTTREPLEPVGALACPRMMGRACLAAYFIGAPDEGPQLAFWLRQRFILYHTTDHGGWVD
jgi:hypothetical protein